jgi:osmoprotectant transport system ATP-binding protein
VQEAFELGDRICLMDKGKILQNGTPAELLFSPANTFVRDFLQGQRLQLEFKAIRLSDLWRWLPNGRKESKLKALRSGTDLWTGLEQFKFTSSETMPIDNKETNETRHAGFGELMEAFYQYKKHKAHE